MSKIAIVSDSGCDLPEYIIQKYDIKILPLRVIYKNAQYKDRVDIWPQEVYDRLEEEIPKTSLPEPTEIIELFDRIANEGYTDVICITLSSKLSGTYNLIQLIASEYDKNKLNIKVVDSKALSMLLGFIVFEAAIRAKSFETVDTILNMIADLRGKIKGCYVLKTLKYLKKGGRIGKVEGTVGEFLDIKPIIGVDDDGVYYTIQKVRGRKKSINKIKELIENNFIGKRINIAIIHGGAEEEAKLLMDSIKDLFDIKESFITQISPALGVHTGPGLIGYSAYEVF